MNGGTLLSRWLQLITRHPWIAAMVVLTTTVGAAWVGLGIDIKSDMEALFPEDSPAVIRARTARRVLGERAEVVVLIASADRDLNRRVAAEVGARFERHTDLVKRVEVRRDTAFFEKNALLYLSMEDLRALDDEVTAAIAREVRDEVDDFEFDFGDEDEKKAKTGDGEQPGEDADEDRLPSEAELRERYGIEGFSEWAESEDGTLLAVKLIPTFPPSQVALAGELNRRIDEDVATVFARYPGRGLKDAREGDYAYVTHIVDQIGAEGLQAFLYAIVGISLMLLLWFRRLRAVTIMMAALVAGSAWTLCFAWAALGELNIVTASIFSVMVGLGIDFVVHGTVRTDEEMAAGRPLEEALSVGLQRVGGAMGWAAVAQTATLFALVVFEFRGLSQFGLLAGVGVLFCLASAYVVLPILEAAFHRVRARPVPKTSRAPRAGGWFPGRRTGWALLVLFGVLAVAGGVSATDLRFEADMRKLRTRSTEEISELRQRYRDEIRGHAASPALVLTDDIDETRRVHVHIESLIGKVPLLEEVKSIATLVPTDQQARLPLVREIKRKIDNKHALLEGDARADADRLLRHLEPEPFGADALPEWIAAQFRDADGHLGRFVLLYVRGAKSDADTILRIEDAIGEIPFEGRVYRPTASWFILGDALRIVKREGPWAVALASLVVLLFLMVDLRSVRDVLTVFVPLCTGFAVFLGVLAVAEIHLNLFNIIVLPTIFGIGVDTAIHLVHRLNEGDDLAVTLRTTGRAATISTATDSVGFLALTVVSNEGLQSIGHVAVIGIVTTYITTVGLITAIVLVGWKRPPDGPSKEVAAA